MRLTRSHLLFLLALVSVPLVTSATTGSAAEQVKAQPKVTISGTAPVTVTGVGFRPRERVSVRLVVGGGEPLSRTTRATPKGRFAVQFSGVTVPECVSTLLIVTVNGIRTTSASARMRTIPAPCGPFPQE